MWEIQVSDQMMSFLLSLALGVALCLFYDLFRIIRLEVKQKSSTVFIEDIVFWIISAFVVYSFFLLRTNGAVRSYILLGALLGFLFCRATLSVLLLKTAKPIFWIIKKGVAFYRFVMRKIGSFAGWVWSKMRKLTLKSAKTAKSLKKLFTRTKNTT